MSQSIRKGWYLPKHAGSDGRAAICTLRIACLMALSHVLHVPLHISQACLKVWAERPETHLRETLLEAGMAIHPWATHGYSRPLNDD
jgi:hypothetical protein